MKNKKTIILWVASLFVLAAFWVPVIKGQARVNDNGIYLTAHCYTENGAPEVVILWDTVLGDLGRFVVNRRIIGEDWATLVRLTGFARGYMDRTVEFGRTYDYQVIFRSFIYKKFSVKSNIASINITPENCPTI